MQPRREERMLMIDEWCSGVDRRPEPCRNHFTKGDNPDLPRQEKSYEYRRHEEQLIADNHQWNRYRQADDLQRKKERIQERAPYQSPRKLLSSHFLTPFLGGVVL